MARPDLFKKLNQTVSSFSAEMVASRQFAANGDEIHTAMRKELLNRICNTGGKVIPANRASPPRGTSHIKETGVLIVPFRGQKCGFVPLRVFSFKKSSVVAFVVPLRVEIRQRFMTLLSKTFKRGKSA